MKGGRGVNVERKVEKQGEGKGKQAEREMRGEGKKQEEKGGRGGKEKLGKKDRKEKRKGKGKECGNGEERGKERNRGKQKKKAKKGRELGEKERGRKPHSGHSTVPIVLTYSGILSRRIWENKTDPVEKCAFEESIPGLHLGGVGGTPLPVCTASL